jgi:hypothetical protein
MRTYLAAALVLGLATVTQVIPARAADIHIGPGGVSVDQDHPGYWRSDEAREHEWRRREAWREAQREDWRRDHCVRDWRNEVYCH